MTNTITRINAQFSNLVALRDGEYLTGDSVATISTINAEDSYTVVRSIRLGDIAEDDGDHDNFRDAVNETLSDIAGEIAAQHGLAIIDTDGDEQTFWAVRPI